MRTTRSLSILTLIALLLLLVATHAGFSLDRSPSSDPRPSQPDPQNARGPQTDEPAPLAPADPAGQPPSAGRDAPLWDKGASYPEAAPAHALQKIEDGVYRLGNISIDKRSAMVAMPGEINMNEGLVEYLACAARGKLHESVLKLDVDPYELQIALLLVGLEPGGKPLANQGDSGVPEGDRVELWVSWTEAEGKRCHHRAEELIWDNAANRAMAPTYWVFTGSTIVNGRFMAEVEQSIAAVYHDPFALLDHPLPTGADDTVHEANRKLLPANGTPVVFEIRSVNPPPPKPPRPDPQPPMAHPAAPAQPLPPSVAPVAPAGN